MMGRVPLQWSSRHGGVRATADQCSSLSKSVAYTILRTLTCAIPLPTTPQVGTSWGMSDLYPYTLSSTGLNAYTPWNFSLFPADAVVINLGTNEGWRRNETAWQAEYVQFVQEIVHSYYQHETLPVFLTTTGPMTNAYAPLVANVVDTLVGQGLQAHPLNLSLGRAMTGCYGHPSHADNIEIAAVAKLQIGKVLGWL